MVYNPYEDPNLVKRQDKMHNSGLGAFIKPVQQGADAFAGAMENSPVAAPMRRAMADNAAQKTMIAIDQNRKERTALGAQFPEGREVFSNNRGMVSNMDPARSAEVVTEARGLRNPVAQAAGMTPPAPVSAPVVAGGMMPTSGEGANNPTPVLNSAQGQLPGNTGQVPAAQPAAGAGIGVNLSERDKAIRASLAAVDNEVARMGQKGIPVSPQQAEQIVALKQQAGFLRGGTDRVPVGPDGRPIRPGGAGLNSNGIQRAGNLDVQFNPSVSTAERGAFMAQPSAPAPIAAHRGPIFGTQGPGSDSRASDEQAPPAINTFGDIMNAKYRMAQSKIKNQAEQNRISRLQNQTSRDNAELTAKTHMNVARMTEGTAAERNRIDAKNVDSQIVGAGLDQEGKRLTIDEQKRIQGLRKAYDEAKTPAEKAIAEKALIASGAMKRDKPEVFFDEERDQMGNVIRKTPYILENGVVRPAVGGAGIGEKVEAAPVDIKKRVDKKVYVTPSGQHVKWDAEKGKWDTSI